MEEGVAGDGVTACSFRAGGPAAPTPGAGPSGTSRRRPARWPPCRPGAGPGRPLHRPFPGKCRDDAIGSDAADRVVARIGHIDCSVWAEGQSRRCVEACARCRAIHEPADAARKRRHPPIGGDLTNPLCLASIGDDDRAVSLDDDAERIGEAGSRCGAFASAEHAVSGQDRDDGRPGRVERRYGPRSPQQPPGSTCRNTNGRDQGGRKADDQQASSGWASCCHHVMLSAKSRLVLTWGHRVATAPP